MDFARQQRDPTRHLIGITFVIVLHALILWAMVSGLARKAVEVIKKPITATIIEEIKAPPPPPPAAAEEDRRRAAAALGAAAALRAAAGHRAAGGADGPDDHRRDAGAAAEAGVQDRGAAPAGAAEGRGAAGAAAKPAIRKGITPVTREDPVYPRAAIRAGIDKGRVLARVNIDEKGNVTDVIIVSADPPRHFDSSVREALSKWKFQAEGEKYVGEIEVVFTLKD